MNENLTDISIVLDRSGSMSSIKDDTIGGYNEFLKGQREAAGTALVSLYQFDDLYETVYEGVDIKEVPDLTAEVFVPRGSTALRDAIGRTIDSTGARLAKMSEADRPARVILVIFTDGGENSSQEYTRARTLEMVKHQTEAYKWQFVFVGANQDAIMTGADYGISASNSLSFAATSGGVKSTMRKVTKDITTYRAMGSAAAASAGVFSDEDREECMAETK